MRLNQTNINLLLGGLNIAQNYGSGSIAQSLSSPTSFINLGSLSNTSLLGNSLGTSLLGLGNRNSGLSNSLALALLLGRRRPAAYCPPAKPRFDLNTLLLLKLLGGSSLRDLLCGDCGPKPKKPTSIIDLLFPPGEGTGPINTGEGDPHMNIDGVGKFDFHGPTTAQPGQTSTVRLMDEPNGAAINVGLRHLDYKLPGQNVYASFFHNFAAKLGNSKVGIDADAKTMVLDGQEVKVGEGKAVSLGNGKSATVSRPNDNTFIINTGRQILKAVWKALNTAGAKGYFDISTQVTTEGLDSSGPSGGMMNLGHLGLSTAKIQEIIGNQDTMYNLFKVNGLDDLAGQRVPAGGQFVGAFAGGTSSGNI